MCRFAAVARTAAKATNIALGSVGVAGIVGLGAIGLKVHSALHPPRKQIEFFPKKYGLGYEDTKISYVSENSKKIDLSAWIFTPEQNGVKAPTNRSPIVIFGHGYGMNRVNNDEVTLEIVKSLVKKGITCVLFDFPNHGQIYGEKTSDNGLTTIGANREVESMIAVINEMNQRGYDDIGLIGTSMGAATALNTAAKSPIVQAVIADSSYSDLKEYLSESIRSWTKLIPPSTVNPLFKLLEKFGVDAKNNRPIDAAQILAEANVPVRFYHTEEDTTIPVEHSKVLANVYKEYAHDSNAGQILTITSAKGWEFPPKDPRWTLHIISPHIYENYIEEVVQFFDTHLGNVQRRARNESTYEREEAPSERRNTSLSKLQKAAQNTGENLVRIAKNIIPAKHRT